MHYFRYSLSASDSSVVPKSRVASGESLDYIVDTLISMDRGGRL